MGQNLISGTILSESPSPHIHRQFCTSFSRFANGLGDQSSIPG